MLFRTPSAPSRRARRSPWVRVEPLERRDCPSGGLLDPTFNGTGMKTVASSVCDTANAAVVQPDGKVVSVGHVTVNGTGEISVVRLNRNGSPDTTFNGTGSIALKVGVAGSNGNAIALQPDGKIVIGGGAYSAHTTGLNDTEYVVIRLNANGSLDKTFGKSGTFAYDPTTGPETVNSLAVLPDGSILAAGWGMTSAAHGFAALKLAASGAPNTTFGSGGIAVANIGDNGSGISMAVMPTTGQIIMAGETPVTTSSPGGAGLAVLTQAGRLDTTFNGTGTLVNPGMSSFGGVAVQGSATQGYKIVAAGNSTVGRYLLSGAVDTTFGGSGTGFFTVPATARIGFGPLALEADGSIIVGGSQGYTDSAGNYLNKMLVAHLSADGILDTSFGPDGTGYSIATNGVDSNVYGLAIDPNDGGIIAVGYGKPTLNTRGAAFARFTAP